MLEDAALTTLVTECSVQPPDLRGKRERRISSESASEGSSTEPVAQCPQQQPHSLHHTLRRRGGGEHRHQNPCLSNAAHCYLSGLCLGACAVCATTAGACTASPTPVPLLIPPQPLNPALFPSVLPPFVVPPTNPAKPARTHRTQPSATHWGPRTHSPRSPTQPGPPPVNFVIPPPPSLIYYF